MDYYYSHGRNARLTCRHFDLTPQTFYRWLRRFDRWDLTSLEDRSRRPHHVRQPTWSGDLDKAVLELRRQYPRWGKDKLVVLLKHQGWEVSTSMVGRILKRLKERGVLVEPVRKGISARKRKIRRPHAVRKPKQYQVIDPGDLVEVDTLDIRPLPGVVLKHFTARDIISRWDVIEVHSRATAETASTFLDAIEKRMPFDVRAIQVDGGSEFQSVFEEECKRRDIKLFVLPPRSPKLNAHVERAQRTHTEEFYEVRELPWTVGELNPHCLDWEEVYNTVRPHQSLGYLTPAEFLDQAAQQAQIAAEECH
jgi:transposase InsO family protein